jgi:predicted ATPase/DNA-binding SARP family transcriptional activator
MNDERNRAEQTWATFSWPRPSTRLSAGCQGADTLCHKPIDGDPGAASAAEGVSVRCVNVEFALLGPLEVRCDGGSIPLRRGRPRTLLLSLLLRVGRVVPTDVLIDDVWREHPLSDPANALQGQVSYLRRVLRLSSTGPAPALRTSAGGYVLDIDPASVDVRRFERQVSSAGDRLGNPNSGDAEAALSELRSALDLWRGEPLQDVASEPFAVAEVQRLRELRAAALEYEIDALLVLGRHEQAVPALRRLIAEHPLRERFRAQLVLALYRSGRQADALREFDATRAQLVEELGLEPGPDLRRLQRAVLGHDPVLDWVRPTEPAGPAAPPATAEAQVGRSRPRSLPAPTTRLVGRAREITRIHDALADNRMVTLTGPGGVGKTRLALAVAHTQAARRPVWLVELADVGDETVVPFEIARAVGVATHTDPLEALAVGIGSQPGLLVLDTCEHLIDICAAAAHRLLRACPALDVLATSQQPLAVAGEVAWPVPPLAVPSPDAPLDEVGHAEAVRLFYERSRAVRPGFELDASNAPDVAAICRVLDGLPLAIELAAARIKVLSPAGILTRLDDRFALLRRVGRASDVRQQSLRAAIEWSHDLLDRDQRRFFERLGVFAGRFTFDAAAAVAADGLAADPLELISAMVDRSLIVTDGDDSYRMLDSLRAFAVDRLGQTPGEGDAARERLARWLAEFCEATDAHLRAADRQVALDQLRAEVPNLRAALEWSFTPGDRMIGVRLACSLVWFWGWVGANEEANRWLHRALETTGLDNQRQARLLEGIAMHAFALGETAAGQRAAQAAARLWTDAAMPQRGFAALVYQGLSERRRGELDSAAATHDRAVTIARDSHDEWGLAVALYYRAATAADQHDDSLAAGLLAEALSLAEGAGDRRAVGSIVHQLGRIALRRGAAERALDLAQRALAIHEAIGWNEGIAGALEAVGRALVARGHPIEAVASHRRGLQIATERGLPHAITKALEGLADALAATGNPDTAAEVLGSAAAMRSQTEVPAHVTQRRVVAAIESRLRDRLGEQTFEAAFRRGERLGPREVIAASDPGDGPAASLQAPSSADR